MRSFNDLPAFMAQLALTHQAIDVVGRKALAKAARLVEKTAHDKLGVYQAGVGPYNAWDALSARTLERHEQYGVGDTPLVLTGAMRSTIEHEIQDNVAVIGSKSDVAFWQEFGTPTIPPRPFIGPAAFENRDAIEQMFALALATGIMGGTAIR